MGRVQMRSLVIPHNTYTASSERVACSARNVFMEQKRCEEDWKQVWWNRVGGHVVYCKSPKCL
ncbi:hypothetical protein BDR05DRAFT_966844 [Suillus weaverae]|nr:hypothetical protein BDR05DRAFT_966844 [Suillus weaverae]